MGKLIVDVSPSVDRFVAGPGVAVEQPFGTAGHRLHRWLGFEGATQSAADRESAERMFATAGAFGVPSFVLTNRPHAEVHRGPTTSTSSPADSETPQSQTPHLRRTP